MQKKTVCQLLSANPRPIREALAEALLGRSCGVITVTVND